MADPFDPDHKTYVEPVDTIARRPEPDTGMTDDFDPFPLPQTPPAPQPDPHTAPTTAIPEIEQDWDYGAPDGFWDAPNTDTDMPDLDPIIDPAAAAGNVFTAPGANNGNRTLPR